MESLFVGEKSSRFPKVSDGLKQSELTLRFPVYFCDDKSNEHSAHFVQGRLYSAFGLPLFLRAKVVSLTSVCDRLILGTIS